ncbi:hypothetical protein PsB1_2010 [Candidatus Phycosocius spiralis]|uniref:Uncharacterized protein n=1 Tax=Candidatus Phycosocius spiralis TaxID=2815099 RepID=A0ABQ4PXR3_9PROT|nr:hypothetical protein PsB1_2010 [Candidatus Phycosocius spiralis]
MRFGHYESANLKPSNRSTIYGDDWTVFELGPNPSVYALRSKKVHPILIPTMISTLMMDA